ncbi:MAG: exopolysaccharide biosynthesis protein [Bacteroidales bacterium]|nr:exopolysaccharide biosynthesis protein [Bacteroidales bacterium]
MNSLTYILRFLYGKRFWLIILPIMASLVAIKMTENLTKYYSVKTTIFTGVVSGYDIESGDGQTVQDWNRINNAMDNIMEIVTAQTTLKKVSMRLFAQHMMYGDPEKDNLYITSKKYKELLKITPKAVLDLVDKNSEDTTLKRFYAYEKVDPNNFLYGLFNYTHPHYSNEALSKIKVKRVASSDMIEISYVCDDPGIAYSTLVILNEEFVNQYRKLRFGETYGVIEYFESELARVGKILRGSEDELTNFNVANKVINYDEQTKQIAALSRDYELNYEKILLRYHSANNLVQSLEERIDNQLVKLKNNTMFVDKMGKISELSSKIAMADLYRVDTVQTAINIKTLNNQLEKQKKDLLSLTNEIGIISYSKEGIATSVIVDQWLSALIELEQSKAELQVMIERKKLLDSQYGTFSPIGSILKRKEREINVSEQTYLSLLTALNNARMRQKNLQMSSATLKVINAPEFPITCEPTKRKMMVIATFLGTLIFLLGYFLIIDLFDRTLRDNLRAERILSHSIIGAIPFLRLRSKKRNTILRRIIVAKYLGNSILTKVNQNNQIILNILSIEKKAGKSYVARMLAEYFTEIGMEVALVSYHKDFDIENKEFSHGSPLNKYVDENLIKGANVVIVEYPPLRDRNIHKSILIGAQFNLMVLRADYSWRDVDQLLFNRIIKQVSEDNLDICLNMTKDYAAEVFTGLLPPYTFMRKLSYKFYQQGASSTTNEQSKL